MPPREKVTEEMVVDAAFALAREAGAEGINARSVAQKLGCSTQPVMRHFATIEKLRRAAFERADDFHTGYIMGHAEHADGDALLSIGLSYIRFAVEETNLFRFLFQSGMAPENSLPEYIDAPQLQPVLEALQREAQAGPEQAREIFVTLALFAHGYASLLANSSLEYDQTAAAKQLEHVYAGAVLALQKETTSRTPS